MLSIRAVKAGQAKNYYEKDDYYSRELEKSTAQSGTQWQGKGAQNLGLSGEINKDTFGQLLEGYTPLGKSLQSKQIDPERHRAGIDLTFSAPKSVSFAGLVEKDDRVINAHDIAVERSIEIAEKRYTQARVWDPEMKQQTPVETENLIVAKFRHETSRNLDPQLHTHAVLINSTQMCDGTWRAMSSEELFRQKQLLDGIYLNELAYELRRHGYEIRQTKDAFEIEGYTAEHLKVFSSRRQEIESYVTEQIKQGEKPSQKLYGKATQETRTKKQNLSRDALLENWRSQSEQLGYKVPETPRDKSQTWMTDNGQSAAIQSVESGVEHASEREAVFRRESVERFALRNQIGNQSWAQLQTAIQLSPDLIRASESAQELLTTRVAIEREAETIEMMRQSQGRHLPILSEKGVESRCPENLTKGQRDGLKLMLTSRDGVMAWQGVAGSGKTYALKEGVEAANEQGYRVRSFAPSAESATILGQEIGAEASTVARWLVTEDKPINERELWVVDEAGLMSAKDAHVLLKKAQTYQARVLLVGDIRQQSAVEAGSPFRSLQEAGMETAKLEESRRQKTPYLRRAVQDLAKGKISESLEQLWEAEAIRAVKDEGDRVNQMTQNYLQLSPREREKTLVVVHTNAERRQITAGIRAGLQQEGNLAVDTFEMHSLRTKDLTQAQARYAKHYGIGDVIVPVQSYKRQKLQRSQPYEVIQVDLKRNQLTVRTPEGETQTIRPREFSRKTVYQAETVSISGGEELRWTRNDPIHQRRNGQAFTVEAVSEKGAALIRYRDGRADVVDLSGLQFADSNWVSTVYSSQGKTADRVLASCDLSTSRESFYVVASRARYDLQIYTTEAERLKQLAHRSRVKDNPSEYLSKSDSICVEQQARAEVISPTVKQLWRQMGRPKRVTQWQHYNLYQTEMELRLTRKDDRVILTIPLKDGPAVPQQGLSQSDQERFMEMQRRLDIQQQQQQRKRERDLGISL